MGHLATALHELIDNTGEILMLKQLVIKQSEQIDTLKREVVDLKSRSMRKIAIFHNVPETPKKDCEEKGYVSPMPAMENAHRVGLYNSSQKKRDPLLPNFSPKSAQKKQLLCRKIYPRGRIN
jgi:hypothetical protein